MNRRDFGKMVLGTGVASAVPVSGLAGAVAGTAKRSKYIFAVALAHNRVDISADMISDMFDVRPPTARRLLSKLVKNGVVDAPNASGIARLAEPLQRIVPQVVEYNPAGGYIVKGRLDELTNKVRTAADKIKEFADSAETEPDSDETAATEPETPKENLPVSETLPPSAS